ncbi:hypothetical protein BT93_E1346 [Corymbia citriodora subsp. variegata]|nr:hypothetical protein BT93_E1346 [Corymbia citriodora subsp. variegata]
MGFLLAAISLLVLYLAINLFMLYYGNDWEGLFGAITSYGLGGSSMALFGRASGGIYAKAADVCVHLVGKIKRNSPEDDRNPAVIPNFVGDIVGDIADVGTDLFVSYAESSCAALVLASISSFGTNHDFTAVCYPLLISSMGILVCLITTLMGRIMPDLEKQLIFSTILLTFGIAIVSWIALPSSFTIDDFGSPKVVKNWQLSLCVGVGLWAGQISGIFNKYYTNDYFSCLQHVNDAANNFRSCLQDVVAIDFHGGLQGVLKIVSVALGSVSIPFFAAISMFVCYRLATTYGIAVAALGMLSTFATRLAINAYGPISNNAKRIAEVAGVGDFDTAGDITAAIGKEFAIESAALVSIALILAFVSRAAISLGDILTPNFFIGLTAGAGLPYKFSAMTMKSVGRAGLKMAKEVCTQLEEESDLMGGHKEPIYATCFKILTDASFLGMIIPGALVTFTPLFFGTVFGVETLCGVLFGSLGSVVQIAISASNNGEAWDKVKEYIKAGALEHVKTDYPGDLELSRKAESGETVGDPLKEPSGPPLNILVQWQSSR